MSAVDEGGARRGNPQIDRPAGQQRQNQSQTPNQNQNVTRESTTNTQSRRGGKNGPGVPSTTKTSDAVTTPPTFPVSDEHTPLNGFNSAEIDTFLKKGVDSKNLVYRVESHVQQAKAQSPWGAKPGSMANGRDFFLELRKQVTTLQQSGGVSQGG